MEGRSKADKEPYIKLEVVFLQLLKQSNNSPWLSSSFTFTISLRTRGSCIFSYSPVFLHRLIILVRICINSSDSFFKERVIRGSTIVISWKDSSSVGLLNLTLKTSKNSLIPNRMSCEICGS